MPVGSGHVDLFAFGEGVLGSAGTAGAGIDYEHRISRGISTFATGRAGMAWGDFGRRTEWDALGGLRWRW